MPASPPNRAFHLFVYGTLKKGFGNHDRFCKDVRHVEEAAVRGRLYDLPFGFPALVVEPENVHATGSTDPVLDTSLQYDLQRTGGDLRGPVVYGELLTFEDPEERLPKLDHLEGFDPGGQSLYRRVLVPVEISARSLLAWTYAVGKPTGTHLPGGRWPLQPS